MDGPLTSQFDCSNCKAYQCEKRDTAYPSFCPTAATDEKCLEEIKAIYTNDPLISKLYSAATEIEGVYYGKLTRVEEIILFAKKIDAKKIGIATCIGTITEASVLTSIMKSKGVNDYLCVCCKVGSISKEEAGIPEGFKINPDMFEPACNPVLQAEILNDAKTDLNILIGLCVGHDALFTLHSKAPCTTLAVKDRVLQHNPMAAIYGANSYYKRLLKKNDIV